MTYDHPGAPALREALAPLRELGDDPVKVALVASLSPAQTATVLVASADAFSLTKHGYPCTPGTLRAMAEQAEAMGAEYRRLATRHGASQRRGAGPSCGRALSVRAGGRPSSPPRPGATPVTTRFSTEPQAQAARSSPDLDQRIAAGSVEITYPQGTRAPAIEVAS